jgi:hypothetical protein
MAYSTNTTIASGTTANVAVPFPYINQSDVHVMVNGVQVTDSLLVWPNSNTIALPSMPTAGASLEVYRLTDAASLASQLVLGAYLDPKDVNSALTQVLYVCQEAFDQGAINAAQLASISNYVNTAVAAAQASAVAAAGSATVATGAASTSTTQAGVAATWTALAQAWASQATGTVDGTNKSAKQYAADAASSAVAAAAVVASVFTLIGSWNASTGVFPGGGVAQKGWVYLCSVAGTVGGLAFSAGDTIYAIVNNASTSTYAGNWVQALGKVTYNEIATALGYTPLSPNNNLSELTSASAARTNLGLGSAATLTAGTGANNVVQLNNSAQLPGLDASLLIGLPADNFSSKLLHVRDEKTSGTAGGTFTSGAWQTRTLNTVKANNISGASLGSNQITLPAGTYFIQAAAPANQVNDNCLKLYNITDLADVVIGRGANSSSSGGYASPESTIWGRFTITGTKVFELRHICASTESTDGFGRARGFGTEVYAEALIWKVG